MEFVMIETGWMSVIPPVLAITLALITKEVCSSLFIGRFRLRGPLLADLGYDDPGVDRCGMPAYQARRDAASVCDSCRGCLCCGLPHLGLYTHAVDLDRGRDRAAHRRGDRAQRQEGGVRKESIENISFRSSDKEHSQVI